MHLVKSRTARAIAALLLAFAALNLPACDLGSLNDDGGSNPNDPFDPNNRTDSKCDFGFTDSGEGKDFGEACASDSECRYGVCIPGDSSDGNRANLVSQSFGYCTRACDCGTTATRLSDEEKAVYLCLYPPGNEGRWRHIVLKCDSVSDCQAVDPRWGSCALPGTGVTKVCME